MKRFMSIALCTALLGPILASPSQAASRLRQTHPAKWVPNKINKANTYNEYPWFSHDGRLFFWTREEPIGSAQKLFVIYIQNFDEVWNAPAEGPGVTLPPLDIGTYTEVDAVNDWVRDHFQEALGQGEIELRSYAICHEPGEEVPLNQPAQNRWRYRFSIYLAARTPQMSAPVGELWRFHNLIADVDKTTFDITIRTAGSSQSPVVAPVFNPWIPTEQINETEPYFSRDSRYFFWAGSYGFGGMGLESHYIGPYDGCSQLMQPPKPFQTLPTAAGGPRFYWKDQYAEPADTAYTNYHAMAEMGTGRTALIFTQCRAKLLGARQSWCIDPINDNLLSTTGFTANGVPSNIFVDETNRNWTNRNLDINKPGRRVSHPAVAGPMNPADGTWLLFYMQGRRLRYAKVKHTICTIGMTPGSGPCPP